MSVQAISIEKPRTGTCPHGNPAGACPICSGMGGGGKNISNDHNTRRNAGEMTWNECYAMGLILKQRALEQARVAKQEAVPQNLFSQIPVLNQIAAKLSVVANNIGQVLSNTAKNIKQNIINPQIKNLQTSIETIKEKLAKFSEVIQNKIVDLKQKLIDISDKMAAILGEFKNAIDKKITEGFKRQLKKISGFLALINPTEAASDEEDDDTRKRIFEYKIKDKDIKLNLQQNEYQED